MEKGEYYPKTFSLEKVTNSLIDELFDTRILKDTQDIAKEYEYFGVRSFLNPDSICKILNDIKIKRPTFFQRDKAKEIIRGCEVPDCFIFHEESSEKRKFILLDTLEKRLLDGITFVVDSGRRDLLWKNIDPVCQTINDIFKRHGLGYEYNQQSGQFIPFVDIKLQEEVVPPCWNLLSNDFFREKFGKDNPLFCLKEAYTCAKDGSFQTALTHCRRAIESFAKIDSIGNKKEDIMPTIKKLGIFQKDEKLSNLLKSITSLSVQIGHNGTHEIQEPTNHTIWSAMYCIHHTHATLLYLAQEYINQ